MSRRARRAWLGIALGLILLLIPGALALGPRLGRAIRLHLAGRDVAGGRLPEAEARLASLISERPGETRARLLIVEVLRRLGRITEAEDALQRAVELGLTVDQGRREFALLAAGRDFPGAERSLREVLRRDPDDLEVRGALAEGFARAGRWPEAEAACTDWLAKEPGSDRARLLRADARLALGLLDLAEADDESSRKLRPDRPGPLVGLAASASARGRPEEADRWLDRALVLDPGCAPALSARGRAFLARGRVDLAIPLLERLAIVAPLDLANRRTLALLRRPAGDRSPSGIEAGSVPAPGSGPPRRPGSRSGR